MTTMILMTVFSYLLASDSMVIVVMLMVVSLLMTSSGLGEYISKSLVCDVFSFSFTFLALIVLMACSFMWFFVSKKNNLYSQNLIMACLFSVLAFSSSSALLFYICFEVSVLPVMFIIMSWGYQPERLWATKYLIMYTLLGSMPLLALILSLGHTSSFDFFQLKLMYEGGMFLGPKFIMLLMSTLAFLIKTPMFFFHMWLPKAHVEAPVVGSMFLAAVMLKLGSCGLIRLSPLALGGLASIVTLSVSVVSLVMVGVVNLSMTDMKMMIAFSSVSHMALGLGALTMSEPAAEMVAILMFTLHGVSSSSMFMISYLLYTRSNSRSILLNKTYKFAFPNMAFYLFMFSMGLMGAPPTMNILAEAFSILILSSQKIPLVFLVLGVLICSIYTINFFSLIFHRKKIPLFSGMVGFSPMEEIGSFWSLMLIIGIPLMVIF